MYLEMASMFVVAPQDGERYLKALREGLVPREDLDALVEQYGPQRTRPVAVIDFDNALFVSPFFDQALEDEVGPGWSGSCGDPMVSAPPEFQAPVWNEWLEEAAIYGSGRVVPFEPQ